MLFSTPALVLDKNKTKEIDYSVLLLTPNGRIWVVAKGAQKSKRRFLNLLDDLTFIRAHIRRTQRGKTLILEKADLLYLPESLRIDLKKYFFSSYVAEILAKTAPASMRGQDFLFIVEFIKELDRGPLQRGDKLFWEIRWLEISGFTPYLDACVACGKPIRKVFYFSVPRGGLICFRCKDEGAYFLSPLQIELLRKIVRIKKLKDFRELMANLSSEVIEDLTKLIEIFFLYHLDWEPKSLRILKEGGF